MASRRTSLTPDEARRTVLRAQGFGAGDGPTDRRALMRQIRRLGILQIDSVNVLSRAHYLPLFSRLGSYERPALDDLAARRPRRLFEYWAHEASLLPVETQPLLRWRMARDHAWGSVSEHAQRDPALVSDVLTVVAEMGPATTAQIEAKLGQRGPRAGEQWGWNWSQVKTILEHLFWIGEVSSAGRDTQFRRRYALTSQVLPADVLSRPTPEAGEAKRGLVEIATSALGVATLTDLRDWFRLTAADTRHAVTQLVEDGTLTPVTVPGWPNAWLHRDATVPRTIQHDALLVPFDPLIWERGRVERLFRMKYRVEIYVPAAKREFGYYVLPFVQDDRLTARVDLKADRDNGVLLVRSCHGHEPDEETPDRLTRELCRLMVWLDLSDIKVAQVGNLAAATHRALRVSVG